MRKVTFILATIILGIVIYTLNIGNDFLMPFIPLFAGILMLTTRMEQVKNNNKHIEGYIRLIASLCFLFFFVSLI